VRTAQPPPKGRPHAFSFVLASCNLSVVSINNLLALALAYGGESVSKSSLELDLNRWNWPWAWLRRLTRTVGQLVIPGVLFFLMKATGVKQPGPPFIRSPFLKLAAVFEARIIEVLYTSDTQAPSAGDVLTSNGTRGVVAATPARVRAMRVQLNSCSGPLPQAGQQVRRHQDSALVLVGVVLGRRADDSSTVYIEARAHPQVSLAKTDVLTDETGAAQWTITSDPVFLDDRDDADVSKPGDLYVKKRDDSSLVPAERICRVVVAQASADFTAGASVRRTATWMGGGTVQKFGTVLACSTAGEWYDNPDFFLHVGDQIYYDFPRPDRHPDRDEYRLSYREAWVDDDAARYFLANWPHYMIFDDHEFADQYARNFVPPNDASPDVYLLESTIAYRDYVHGRNPPGRKTAYEGEGPYWYTFAVGETRFFVLDTRSERWVKEAAPRRRPQMLDEDQMEHLLKWMGQYPNDLKFVVTSIPFVAELPDTEGPLPAAQAAPGEFVRRNRDNDKWSAFDFAGQRDQIIRYVADHDIERLVFLTGDMHCCYHASMHVARRGALKYAGVTIHELAGGPLNQLELGTIDQFTPHCIRQTDDIEYEILLDRFHTEADAVLHIKVDFPEREQIVGGEGRTPTPEVVWNVIRTITDAGTRSWRKKSAAPAPDSVDGPPAQWTLPLKGRGMKADDTSVRPHEPVMSGRICFVPRRDTRDLQPWTRTQS
jgi:hypothetical protein